MFLLFGTLYLLLVNYMYVVLLTRYVREWGRNQGRALSAVGGLIGRLVASRSH